MTSSNIIKHIICCRLITFPKKQDTILGQKLYLDWVEFSLFARYM